MTIHRQHQRELFVSREPAIKRSRVNRRLQYELKPEFSTWKVLYSDTSRQEFTLEKLFLPIQQIIVP